MQYEKKGAVQLQPNQRQEGNANWWTDNTMSYDWKEKSGLEPFTLPWYEDIDRRFLHGARLFDGTPNPFVRLMDLATLAGKRGLEIGCGMGMHSEMMLSAGADLTSIDISPTSIQATQRRLEVKGLRGDVRQMDAESLAFDDATFDFVWSWGVIHHSARTGVVLREINRVLKPGGTVRLMVYNLEGMPAYLTMMRRHFFGFWRGRSLDEQLWKDSDGFTARYYSRDSWRDLLSIFFEDIEISIFGQDADAVPLPRQLRRPAMKLMSQSRLERLSRRRGHFIFSTARKPG